jgi:restriction endonuclease fold toxin 5 of polymorphic toxin system
MVLDPKTQNAPERCEPKVFSPRGDERMPLRLLQCLSSADFGLDATSVPANGVQLVENIGEEASALAQTETETVADAELQAAEESAGAQAQEGEFVEETISNPRAAQYQARITGQPGQAYELNGVRFDGASDAGELLEAKGPGYANLLRQKFAGSVIDKLLAQAARQVAAAAGRQIVWHFAEQEAADAVIEELIKLGIKVVVSP